MSDTELPTTSFAALAFELRVYARREVLSNEGVELFLARYPNPQLARTLDDLRDSAVLVGQAAMLLAALAPHERTVREFLSTLTTSDHTKGRR